MTDPHYTDDNVTLYFGDAIERLKAVPDNSVDSVVTDPPYGLADLPAKKVALALSEWLSGNASYIPATGTGFQGMAWDRFVPPPALWEETFRVLKPGGYLLSFAGARTQDLMGMSIRLAGFKMRDQLFWARADTFNKSKHILKAGYEPIIMAQKPLNGTISVNVENYGTGSLSIEECRTPFRSAADEAESKGKNQHGSYGTLHGGNAVYGDFSGGGTRDDYDAPGRWPTTLLLDRGAAAQLDAANPSSKSRKGNPDRAGKNGNGWGMSAVGTEYDDEGGPARFYPVFEEDPEPFFYAGRATSSERPVVDGIAHVSVKPLSVMEWLIKLATPAGGTVLDPFAGSGTTGEAALRVGRKAILVEAHEPYLPLIEFRISRASL